MMATIFDKIQFLTSDHNSVTIILAYLDFNLAFDFISHIKSFKMLSNIPRNMLLWVESFYLFN